MVIGRPGEGVAELFCPDHKEVLNMQQAIMVVKISERKENSIKVQETLSEFGCAIKTRLGLHEAGDRCSSEGLLVLQLCGEKKDFEGLGTALNEIDGVKAKLVDFDE